MARKAHRKKTAREARRRKNDNPRKGLSADALFTLVCDGFGRIPDYRPPDADISLSDTLMSAFAMFSLKDPSLLAFDQRRNDENLKSIYHIENIPCDTYLRMILDPLDPESLRPLFRMVWKKLGSKKMLWERMRSFFREYIVYSMREVFEALYFGYRRPRPVFTMDSS